MMLSRTGWDRTPLSVAGQTEESRRAPWGCAAGAPYRGTASPPPPPRALPPLLRSVVQSVMQAAAHIPSQIRDALRPTKDGYFDLVGGRWFAPDRTKHAKVVQLSQQHVGPQERVALGGTSIPLHAVIHRMLLSLWYMEKCWPNKIGLTNKEVESYRRAMGQFAIGWSALQWQPIVCMHWTCEDML